MRILGIYAEEARSPSLANLKTVASFTQFLQSWPELYGQHLPLKID
ncbi:MAG: hypothetical protein LRZ84_14895 [Desertifilum sp.]|nr:hypothetical protein [Desertifilum sp.]